MILFIFLLLFNDNLYAQEPSYELAKGIQDIYNPPKKDYVILIDYSKNIYEKRLYVMDMNKKEIILRSTVAHARKSGKDYPTEFSNRVGSKKSCMGAFQTLNSYYGRWGYSMRIKGLDDNINDNTFTRAIVFHPDILETTTWSAGCFTTPLSINRILINMVKNGCLVYVYN